MAHKLLHNFTIINYKVSAIQKYCVHKINYPI